MDSTRANCFFSARTRLLGSAALALVVIAGVASPASAADELNADGWTVLRPASDTRFVFVSSSTGDDRRSGRSPAQAVKTIARAKQLMRDHSADWMLLKRGDSWNESIGGWKISGRSADERLVIASYGDATARPLIKPFGQHGISGSYGENVSHVAIVGIHFQGNRNEADTSRGIRWQAVGEDLLIEDCYIEGYKDNITIEGQGNGYSDVKLRRNIIVDAWSVNGHSQGLYVTNTNNVLLEENLIDHNGWNTSIPGAEASTFNQNVYLQTGVTGVVFRGNISSRAGAAGVQMRSGGLAENNLFYANETAIRFGYTALQWPQEAATGAIKNNVVLGGPLARPVHEVFGIWTERLRNVQVEGNLVAEATDGEAPIAFTLGTGAENSVFQNNTTYDWVQGTSGTALKTTAETSGTPGNVTVRDNRWVMPGAARVISVRTVGAIAFMHNDMEGMAPNANAFFVEGSTMNFSRWVSQPNVTQDEITQVNFVDEGRDLKDYARSLGFTDEAAFLTAARLVSKNNWNPAMTGTAASGWILQGYQVRP